MFILVVSWVLGRMLNIFNSIGKLDVLILGILLVVVVVKNVFWVIGLWSFLLIFELDLFLGKNFVGSCWWCECYGFD